MHISVFDLELFFLWDRRGILPYKIELTYVQKNDPEKQSSRSKNRLNKFLKYGITWSWHHWLKHMSSSMLIVDIRPCFWTDIHLYGYLWNYKFVRKSNVIFDFSLKIGTGSARRSFLLSQKNKRIFSWSCFCTYVHSILYGRINVININPGIHIPCNFRIHPDARFNLSLQ